MKVFKINKKEFIIAIVITVDMLILGIASNFLSEITRACLLGTLFGFSFPLFVGVTKINQSKEPIEIIEIPEGKEN